MDDTPRTQITPAPGWNWKHLAFVLIIALIGTVSFQVNIVIEKKIDDAHQRGLEEGIQQENNRMMEEIETDVKEIGAYRVPMIQENAEGVTTSVKMILILPSQCQKFWNQ